MKLFLLVFVYVYSHGQIIYTDVSPDFTTTMSEGFPPPQNSNLISIDFNNDGIKEYDIRWDYILPNLWYMHLSYIAISEVDVWVTGASNADGAKYIQPLISNINLGQSNGNFQNSIIEPLFGDFSNINFRDLGDRYVGVRFKLGINTHYGWILVNFTSTTLTVKAYAYNSLPNGSINTGQTTLSIEDQVKDINLELYPNPASESIFLQTNYNSNLKTYTIYNLLGQIVLQGNLVENFIDINQLDSGIYSLIVEDDFLKKYDFKFIKK